MFGRLITLYFLRNPCPWITPLKNVFPDFLGFLPSFGQRYRAYLLFVCVPAQPKGLLGSALSE